MGAIRNLFKKQQHEAQGQKRGGWSMGYTGREPGQGGSRTAAVQGTGSTGPAVTPLGGNRHR